MKIVQITAGTGTYHCDTCLRDHALVRALRTLGHDVVLVPLYLPLVTELPDDNDTPLFLGGINAYLQQKLALFRHTPAWIDRLFDARWLLRKAAAMADMTQPRELGEMTVSTLRGAGGNQRKELRKLIAWLRAEEHPDLICLSNGLLLGFAKPLREALGCPVIGTLQGADFFIDGLPEPYRTETWELLRALVAEVDALIAVSAYYGQLMRERLRIPEAKLKIIRNGIDTHDVPPPREPAAPTIGYFSQMTPVKGLGELVEAFLEVRRRGQVPNLQLAVGGSQVPAWRGFVRELRRKLHAACGDDPCWRIEEILDRPGKLAFLNRCTVFSVPVNFPEAYGIYAVEAMAAGVPIVQPRRGAFPELTELTGGGLCYDPDAKWGLADALEALLLDPQRRQSMAAAGARGVRDHLSHDRMAKEFAALAETLLGQAVRQTPN